MVESSSFVSVHFREAFNLAIPTSPFFIYRDIQMKRLTDLTNIKAMMKVIGGKNKHWTDSVLILRTHVHGQVWGLHN